MLRYSLLIMVSLFLCSQTALASDSDQVLSDQAVQPVVTAPQNYFDDRERGWFWYEDPLPEPEKKKAKKAQSPVASSAPKLSPREILKKQGEDWEDAMANAILYPSQENYRRYMAMTSQIMQQSQNFATGFKRALWVTPEYDYTLKNPTTPQAIAARNEERFIANADNLYSAAKKYGLLFFLRSDCPYCHRFAPVLKKFADFYGFEVIPVSVDGGGLPEYPNPRKNHALGRKLNISVVPALFLLNPDTNAVATVSYGFVGWTELVEKMLVAIEAIEKNTTKGARE